MIQTVEYVDLQDWCNSVGINYENTVETLLDSDITWGGGEDMVLVKSTVLRLILGLDQDHANTYLVNVR